MQKQHDKKITNRGKKWIGLLIAAFALVVIAAALYTVSPWNNGQDTATVQHKYSLNLHTTAYTPGHQAVLEFDIRDETNGIVKDFDTVHDRQMHLIVVRADRTHFQHVHPVFDDASGTFRLDDFVFPADGEYRVFADFTPSDAQKDNMGIKQPVTPHQDVTVGNLRSYTPQVLAEKLMSESDGFTTEVTLPHSDSPGAKLYANTENTFAVRIARDGAPFQNLETYLGALGHMVVLGPDLEFVHAHALTQNAASQTGLVYFSVNFPRPGLYKVYLQTQAEQRVSTFDYTLTVDELPGSDTPHKSMNENMNHEEGTH